MARNVALEKLLKDLRVEVGRSTNAAISRSTRTRYITYLNRVQRRLYADFNWPFLEIHRDIKLQDGSRYYDFPDDIEMDRAFRLETKYAGYWQKLGYEIGAKHYNQYDSDQGVKSSPAWRWDYFLEDGSEQPQIELWPIPSADGNETTNEGYLRVHGHHKLTEMVEDADKCLIDADLIVLYAAAEILTKLRSPDAEVKLENANALYMKLKGRATPSKPFTVGGDTFNEDRGRREIELRVAQAGQEE